MNVRANTSKLIGVLTVSFGLSLIPFVNAVASIITFNDLTDIVTVSFSNDLIGRVTVGNDCGTGEVCTVTVLPPNGPAPVNWTSTINIFEPASSDISDIITVDPTNDTSGRAVLMTIVFTSDSELPLTGPFSGNTVVETGLLQTGTSFDWQSFDGTVTVSRTSFSSSQTSKLLFPNLQLSR